MKTVRLARVSGLSRNTIKSFVKNKTGTIDTARKLADTLIKINPKLKNEIHQEFFEAIFK